MTAPTGPPTSPVSGRVAAIGSELRVQGFGLAGVLVRAAADPGEARGQWASLPPDVVVVILTPEAARAIGPRPGDTLPLIVVLPT